MNVDEIVAAAVEQTGLDDFGADLIPSSVLSFREGLDLYVDSLDREAQLNELGAVALPPAVTAALVNRLKVVDWAKQHPEVHTERIEAPIVVIGMFRAGTTFLSHLLDQDPTNRALLGWESQDSAPPPTSETRRTGPRVDAAKGASTCSRRSTPEPEARRLALQLGGHRLARHHRPPGTHAAGGERARVEVLADARAQAVGADDEVGGQGLAATAVATLNGQGDGFVGLGQAGDVAPDQEADAGPGADRVEQERLQVGPVDDVVGRAVGLAGRIPESDAADAPARIEGAHDHARRLRGGPAQGRAEAEADQHAARVRRELEAGADLAEAGPALDQRHRVAGGVEGERGRQAADPGPDDGDVEGAHGARRSLAYSAAALVRSSQTQVSGSAWPAFRLGR